MTLRERIERAIAEHGPIPFSRYMELCLYEPEMGYYARHAEQFGKAGDFYTSSDVHAVFGRLLARQFEEMWWTMGSPERVEVVELGPGRGLFARDVLDWSEKKFPEFFRAASYRLVERSAALRTKLRETLSRHLAAGKCLLAEIFPELQPEAGQRFGQERDTTGERATIVFANEFFDALPVEVIGPQGALRVNTRNGRFVETWVKAGQAELDFLDRYGVHPEAGERVEAPLVAQEYMSRVAAAVGRGFVIAIDYGYTRAELLEGRHRGTVMAYRQHSASANSYEAPGEQDITAHVNFTALAAAVERAGMRSEKLLTQSQFLMGIGEANEFADAFEDCRVPQERAKVALQLKHLVTPAGLGETFHVLVARKGISAEKVERLSGLRFGR